MPNGRFFQGLAAVDVTRADARHVAARVRARMQEEGIICAEVSNSTLGGQGGYGPGPSSHTAVAPTPSRERGSWHWRPTASRIIDTPRAFYSMGEDYSLSAVCPHCGADGDGEFGGHRILCHFEAWQKGDDTLVVTCPHCATAAHLLAWRVNSIVLAHVGLTSGIGPISPMTSSPRWHGRQAPRSSLCAGSSDG
jgi:nitrite reductase/ring-hydroxylating ferredoxin subunit